MDSAKAKGQRQPQLGGLTDLIAAPQSAAEETVAPTQPPLAVTAPQDAAAAYYAYLAIMAATPTNGDTSEPRESSITELTAADTQGDGPVDLSGYTLRDEGPHLYTFGAVVLSPGATVRIHSGRGSDTAAELYWGLAGDAVWNNDGDAAYLRDPAGAFVDSYSFHPLTATGGVLS